jgi:hypothetical protein
MPVTACPACGQTHDDGLPTDLTPIDSNYRQPDDPDQLHADIVQTITTAITGHPRSQQTRPGPSEIGTPCQRRLGYKTLGVPEVNTDRGAAWKPTVGTAVHTWLQQAFTDYNESHRIDRYYLEQKVTVGDFNGLPLRGTADLYDRATGTVLDWKVVGLASLKRYRINGPGDQYRRQGHLYGRGFALLGLPVERVAICFLPQNGELRDLHLWSEPYDEALAIDTLARAEGIAALTRTAGAAILPLLPTADAFCDYCPWRSAASTVLEIACPGHTNSPASALAAQPNPTQEKRSA